MSKQDVREMAGEELDRLLARYENVFKRREQTQELLAGVYADGYEDGFRAGVAAERER